MILITGGSASGKSAYAERLLTERSRAEGYAMTYLATMRAEGAEAQERIAKHRQQRAGLGFRTVECPLHPASAAAACTEAVLLEDLGNLAANRMFDGTEREWENVEATKLAECVFSELCGLDDACRLLVVVTDEVFSDGVRYDAATEAYRALLGRLNVLCAARAAEVYEVVCGIALMRKQIGGMAG